MLIKLIKYDLKSILKTLLPLWLTAIVISGLFGLQFAFNPYIGINPDTVYTFATIVLFALFIAILVITILFIIQRFWNGLLKEEGYLMFTLPVRPRMLILSKVISAFIITLISSIVGIISIGLVAGRVLLTSFFQIADEIQNIVTAGAGDFVMGIIFTLLTLLVSVYRIYAAMAIGQLSNRSRFLFSFGAYIGLGVIESLVTTFLQTPMQKYCLILYVLSLIQIIIYHAITEYLLTRKLNLE